MILNFHQKQRSRFYSYKGKYFVKIAHVYFSRHLLFNEIIEKYITHFDLSGILVHVFYSSVRF